MRSIRWWVRRWKVGRKGLWRNTGSYGRTIRWRRMMIIVRMIKRMRRSRRLKTKRRKRNSWKSRLRSTIKSTRSLKVVAKCHPLSHKKTTKTLTGWSLTKPITSNPLTSSWRHVLLSGRTNRFTTFMEEERTDSCCNRTTLWCPTTNTTLSGSDCMPTPLSL